MVPSSSIVIVANDERLMCSGFSLGEPVCLRNLEFIADYFSDLSLFPRRSDKGTISVGSTHRGASTPLWATIEDSAEEYLTASSGEGGIDHLSPRRRSTGASLAPTSTTTWMVAPFTTRFLLWMAVPRPETNYLSEWCHHEG
jgi:hypothetical protein